MFCILSMVLIGNILLESSFFYIFIQCISGVGILYKKRKPPPPDLFSFLEPLSVDVWIYMITAYLLSSILMFLLGRYDWNLIFALYTTIHLFIKNRLPIIPHIGKAHFNIDERKSSYPTTIFQKLYLFVSGRYELR